MKANRLAGAATRISEAGGVSVQSYEWRIRVYNLGVCSRTDRPDDPDRVVIQYLANR